MSAARPDNLPDFEKPPLTEVVLGIQFSTPGGYSQIHAGQVWNLFRSQFPLVEEQQPIAPIFETFGPVKTSQADVQFLSGPVHDRFWFLSDDQSELLQFQNDRLLHNWRKTSEGRPYPRYERMRERFAYECRRLDEFFREEFGEKLAITQCEITYINQIPVEDFQSCEKILSFLRFDASIPDDVAFRSRYILSDERGLPFGRLIIDFKNGYKPDGSQVYVLELTCRGAPEEPTGDSAFAFIDLGRKYVVSKFADVTTPLAHGLWERRV